MPNSYVTELSEKQSKAFRGSQWSLSFLSTTEHWPHAEPGPGRRRRTSAAGDQISVCAPFVGLPAARLSLPGLAVRVPAAADWQPQAQRSLLSSAAPVEKCCHPFSALQSKRRDNFVFFS